ncbi:MAG: methyltransferase domain-containing protein [Actinobacteria bacterium]|nr:methyltransferase domain-containing protein [Actinomycetota bacterium]
MLNEKKLAEVLEVPPEILPYVPELLADIWALGSWPEEIIELLRSLELPTQSTKVLDLGCGKGAVTLPIAEELGFKIRGVDLFLPFIEEATERAKKLGVENLCHYEVGDIHDVLKEGRTYDVVIFASVGGVLGDFAQCVGQLRPASRPRGYMVIDDGFLAHASRLDRPGYQHYRSHEETIRQLTSYGDTLVQERIIPVEQLKAYNQKNTQLIQKRANKLAQQHPEIADSFERYVRWQEAESYILETETIPAIWLLQRN